MNKFIVLIEKQKSSLYNTQEKRKFIDDLVGGWLLKIPHDHQLDMSMISDWQLFHQNEGVRQFFAAEIFLF